MNRKLVDAKTLAPRLHVRPATLLAWHRRGWVPSYCASRRPVLFDPEEVVAALRKRAEKRTAGGLSGGTT